MKNEKEFLRQKEVLGKAILEEFVKKLSEETKEQYNVLISSKFIPDKLGPGKHGFSDDAFLYITIRKSGFFGGDIFSMTINLLSGFNEVNIIVRDKKYHEQIVKLIELYTTKLQDLLEGKPHITYK